ncbi:hypothetical protein O181_077543 [Austropuccinia psidii MF-1]|uniref:Uncharacterized protein n=1 Tax=Austropuccinia psidii MF-1 TaxID=1389203 RepID=A0A9Q3FD02_9BASI|nr:hypothetical protein [Austropuccinia psidii MF-1]
MSEAPTPDGTSGFSNLTGSRQRDVARWTNVVGPIPVGGRPIYSSSEVPISIINTDGVVKRRKELLIPQLIQMLKVVMSWMALANRFHSHIIPTTPRTFQPTLAATESFPCQACLK